MFVETNKQTIKIMTKFKKKIDNNTDIKTTFKKSSSKNILTVQVSGTN